MRVFIDQCIVSHADTMRGARLKGVIGFVRWEDPDSFPPSKRKDYDCLPSIANLVEEAIINPFSYNELFHENSKRKAWPRSPVGQLFEIPPENYVSSPVERGLFFSMDMMSYVSTEKMVEFCNWLKIVSVESLLKRLKAISKALEEKNLPEVPQSMFKAASNLDRYHELCRGLSDRQCLDAYHLWAAEHAGMNCFLTMDRKLVNAMRNTKKIELPCPLVTPSELLAQLGVADRKPYPYESKYFYSLGGYAISKI